MQKSQSGYHIVLYHKLQLTDFFALFRGKLRKQLFDKSCSEIIHLIPHTKPHDREW